MQSIKAVIFDLDGVIVSTDEFHFQAWSRLAEMEGIDFNRADSERLRGVSRMESLAILLEKATRPYSAEEQLEIADRKNRFYLELIRKLSPADILPGVLEVLQDLRSKGIRLAIGSSSRNAGPILDALGLADSFDIVVDGTQLQRSKPDPQVFLLAAARLNIVPSRCLVVEDAEAGVDAGLAAGMRVVAVGAAAGHPRATLRASSLSGLLISDLID